MSDIPSELESLDESVPPEDVRLKLNRETSKIPWSELQKFYARGEVIAIAAGNDLIDVAVKISEDNKAVVEEWLANGVISQVNDQQAKVWHDLDVSLWAVVISPWILVQEVKIEPHS